MGMVKARQDGTVLAHNGPWDRLGATGRAGPLGARQEIMGTRAGLNCKGDVERSKGKRRREWRRVAKG